MKKKQVLVLAWVDNSGLKKLEGEFEKRDGVNWFQKFRPCMDAKALIFSSDIKDKSRAEAHLATLTDFPCRKLMILDNSKDVLAIARGEILRIASTHSNTLQQ